MKTLFINVTYKTTSTGKIVFDLAKGMENDNNEVIVCYGRGKKEKDNISYKFSLDFETYLHALLARITGLNGYFSFFSTRRLIKYIDKFNPDIIHIHELHAYFVNIKPLIEHIKAKKIRTIWTFHCEYMYTGKCGYAFDCMKYQDTCGNCPHLNEYPKSLFFDKTKKMITDKKNMLLNFNFIIVTPSQWLANRVKTSFLSDKKTVVIHNGVDTLHIFHPCDATNIVEKYNLRNKKTVLSVAPNILQDIKGGKWIFKIAEKMPDIQFILIGANKNETRVISNIIFLPLVTDSLIISQFYSAADVFLLCSKRETFSMTCAESLCCGTPIVGFKCGAPETIFKEPYAKFVEYGNIYEIKNEILKMIECNYNNEKIYEYAKKLYSNEIMYKNYLQAYNTLLSEN